jgi:hypothetical protein
MLAAEKESPMPSSSIFRLIVNIKLLIMMTTKLNATPIAPGFDFLNEFKYCMCSVAVDMNNRHGMRPLLNLDA